MNSSSQKANIKIDDILTDIMNSDNKTATEIAFKYLDEESCNREFADKINIFEFAKKYNSFVSSIKDKNENKKNSVKKLYRNQHLYNSEFERKLLNQKYARYIDSASEASYIVKAIVAGTKGIYNTCIKYPNPLTAIENIDVEVLNEFINSLIMDTTCSGFSNVISHSGINALNKSGLNYIVTSGILDAGTNIYSYNKGEIDADTLIKNLLSTTTKSVLTAFISESLAVTVGTVTTPLVALSIYSIIGIIVAVSKEMQENSAFVGEENQKIEDLIHEMQLAMNSYNQIYLDFQNNHNLYKQKDLLTLTKDLRCNIDLGEHYENIVNSIVDLADTIGLSLTHTVFSDFKDAILSQETFILG